MKKIAWHVLWLVTCCRWNVTLTASLPLLVMLAPHFIQSISATTSGVFKGWCVLESYDLHFNSYLFGFKFSLHFMSSIAKSKIQNIVFSFENLKKHCRFTVKLTWLFNLETESVTFSSKCNILQTSGTSYFWGIFISWQMVVDGSRWFYEGCTVFLLSYLKPLRLVWTRDIHRGLHPINVYSLQW